MSALYVETSALLTWLFSEPAAETVRAEIDAADTAVTSVLTHVEASRAIARAEQDALLSARDAQAVRGVLRRVLAGWVIMEITEPVRDRAMRGFPNEPVRTLDALHLATALEFAQVFGDLQVLSLDARVLGNARALGWV